MTRLSRQTCCALVFALVLAPLVPRAESQAQTPTVGKPFQAAALATQAATYARLQVLGDAFTCPEARFVAYRRSTAEPELADQWYVASQLWADAVLLRALLPPADADPTEAPFIDSSDTVCHVDKGFVFLDRLWDYTSGGYFPRSNPTGTYVSAGARYTDDNSLAGLALLADVQTLPDGPLRSQRLHAARREADFLLQSGVWDDTFGGGFWWNTGRGDSPEGKPAQTNAIAALFLGRLFQATGEPSYREGALRTLLWLDTYLYDPARHLYRWSIAYQDPAHRAGQVVIAQRYFNYDQAIALEAQIVAAELDGNADRLARARQIGDAIHATFWGQAAGGYNLEAGPEQVYTSYAAWTSLGHLALYDVDHDARWLDLVRQNLDALTRAMREPDGGYAFRLNQCEDRATQGCQGGQVPFVVDRTRDTAAQAWVQHLQVALGIRLNAASDEASDAP